VYTVGVAAAARCMTPEWKNGALLDISDSGVSQRVDMASCIVLCWPGADGSTTKKVDESGACDTASSSLVFLT